jgi:hypothetical protein
LFLLDVVEIGNLEEIRNDAGMSFSRVFWGVVVVDDMGKGS